MRRARSALWLAPAVVGVAVVVASVALAAGQGGWRDMPELAPGEPGKRIESRAGRGDPSRGIYLLEQEVEMPSGAVQITPALLGALKKKGFSLTPTAANRAHFEFRQARGEILVMPSATRTVVWTCFYNDRQPQRSATECDAVLSQSFP